MFTKSVLKHGLSNTVLFSRLPSGFAAIRGVPRVAPTTRPTASSAFGLEDVNKSRPARVVDASLTPVFAACPLGWQPPVVSGSARALARLVMFFDLQVFDRNQVVISYQCPSCLVVKVAALVGDLSVFGNYGVTLQASVFRAAFL